MTTPETVTVIVIMLGVAPAISLWWWMADSLKMSVQRGRYDNDAAVRTFISVVDAAVDTLIVHDGGNKIDHAVYDDRDAISAIRRQLKKQRHLRVRFLFNQRADREMVNALRSEFPTRVAVRYTRGGRRQADDIQYKIADAGTVEHLSKHEHAQPEPHFRLLDCSATKPRSRRRVFGKYIKRFEYDFESAQAS